MISRAIKRAKLISPLEPKPNTPWNHANQLTAVTFKTATNVVTKSVQYQYDALGRRIGKSVDDTGDGIMDRRESFVYDGAGLLADAAGSIHIAGPNGALNQAGWTDQLLFVFTDPDADGSSLSQLASRNLYGPAVDQIFATESASGNPLWSLTDHQGTPRDWADLNASGTATIAQHTRYTAFGAIDSITDATGNPLAANTSPLSSFTGQLYDADAGLMYYRARWYDPLLGKFLNDDPMRFEAGDVNVSRYVGNRSSMDADTSGLQETATVDYAQLVRNRLLNVLDDSKLAQLNFYVDDSEREVLRPSPDDPLTIPVLEPGFDCDDYAMMALFYFTNHLNPEFPHMTFTYVSTSGFGGATAHHALLLVENGCERYVIDPQTGQVSEPCYVDGDVTTAIIAIAKYDYNYLIENPEWTLVPGTQNPSVHPPFYEDPCLLENVRYLIYTYQGNQDLLHLYLAPEDAKRLAPLN